MAIVGFGFGGLATLAHLVRDATGPLRIAVVAADTSGHGLAYSTRMPGHLLNVCAVRLGVWGDAPDDFARWVGAVRPAIGGQDYAPRALFARYLDSIRDSTIEQAAAKGVEIAWIDGTAMTLARDGDAWLLRAGSTAMRARSCVLATGNERCPRFAPRDETRLHDGPWRLTTEEVASWGDERVVLIGTGLTAVDAVLSLRELGFSGEIAAFSRNGLLPRAHDPGLPAHEFDAAELAPIGGLAALTALLRRTREHTDLRTAVDALRPHTQTIWQRFSAADQREAIDRWAPVWNVHRHRMAPAVAERIHAELDAGSLSVAATGRRGAQSVTAPSAAVIDCTGPQLDWARSRQPLLRGLLASGACARHATGLGVVADEHFRIGEDLYAIGSLMTGQLWESVAVPELRDQAAAVAGRLAAVTRRRARSGSR